MTHLSDLEKGTYLILPSEYECTLGPTISWRLYYICSIVHGGHNSNDS